MSGKMNAMFVPLTQDEFDACEAAWKAGTLIQKAFPMLNAEQREFIKTGITPAEWTAMFGSDDEGDDDDNAEYDDYHNVQL